MWDINELISNKSIKILLQAIVSIKQKSVLGYEVLSRGIDKNGELISAPDLFERAKAEDKLLELDNLCREKALDEYKYILDEKYLFLNYEISDLNKGEVGKQNLILSLETLNNKLKTLNINTNKIVIEIIESKVKDLEGLQFFTELCKSYGFLVALDDVGSGHSNLNRIPLLKPDIIKIDRYLVNNIHNDYYKQQVFKSITNLSRVIGTIVISEGVETKEEAISSIELRADFIQGFYFSKPSDSFSNDIDNKINLLYKDFKEYFLEKTQKKKDKNRIILKITKELSRELELIIYNNSILKEVNIKNKINEQLKNISYIECIYLLDSGGKQISDTFFHSNAPLNTNRSLFSPAKKGDDHSLKQYFYQLKISHSSHFISKNYISMATGNICRTVTAFINKDIIIAMDINSKAFNDFHVNLQEKRS